MLSYSATIMMCFVLGLMTGSSFGKTYKIKFQSDPEVVRTLVTKELKLECDIDRVQSRSTRVEDIDYIASIQIEDRDGIVASMKNDTAKPFIRAKGFGEKGAQATFDVGYPSGSLHLKVPHPDESNAGNYKCKATVWKKNDNITRTIEVEDDTYVKWKSTSTEELVDIVYKMKNEMLVNINKEIVNNSKEIVINNEKLVNINKEIVNNNKEIVNINNEKLVNINKEIVNLNKAMVKKRQITQGTNICTPQKVGRWTWRYVQVNFGRTYAKPPKVFLSHQYTRGARSGGVNGHNNNWIAADQITTNGFRLGCRGYNKMAGLSVNWIAFPSA